VTPPDDDREHLSAISLSVARGYRFVHMAGHDAELFAIYAERRHGGVVDTYAVMAQSDAWAARFLADEYGNAQTPRPVWHLRGSTAEVIHAVLALPAPEQPGAPSRELRASSSLWTPERH
jgi:hypothetical protein